jgi:hypothetical protein
MRVCDVHRWSRQAGGVVSGNVFERMLALGSEVVDESFEMMFLKELRTRYDTFGHCYGPLVREKVLAPRD